MDTSQPDESKFDPATFVRDLQTRNAEELGERLRGVVEKLLRNGELSRERVNQVRFWIDEK